MFDFEKLTKSAQNVMLEAQTLVKTNKKYILRTLAYAAFNGKSC